MATKLTVKQADQLLTALTMEEANGVGRANHFGDGHLCRALEGKGLMTSFIGTGTTYKGGGKIKRYYRLTFEGRTLAKSLRAERNAAKAVRTRAA